MVARRRAAHSHMAQALSICTSLCECGVNPEALAAVVKELRREGAALKVTITRAHTPLLPPSTSPPLTPRGAQAAEADEDGAAA